MYSSRRRKCCCMNNNCMNCKKEMLEDMCKDVANYSNTSYDECECGFDEDERLFPENPMLGQSYVPWQTMNKTFTPKVGLKMGTIFPELVSPYSPCQSIEENNFIAATNKIGEGCNK